MSVKVTMEIKTNISRIITWGVGAVTVIIVIILPLGFFLISYQNAVGNLEIEAKINANIVTQVISSNPDFWEFEHIRLQEYLMHRPKKGIAELRRIVNTKNEIVAESADALQTPLIMRSSEIMDSGTTVGRIEISRSLRPLLVRTGLLFLLLLPVGIVVFYLLRILPIRTILMTGKTLITTKKHLEATNRRLQEEIAKSQKAEANLHKLNEVLESRVIERTAHLETANRNLEIQIAERKQAEQALIESEKKYRLIAEKMTDIVWTLDINLRTVYVSPSIINVLGFSPEERMVQGIHEQLTPESLSVVMDVLKSELAKEQHGEEDSERNVTLEVEYYHKDSSTRWVENVISGIRNDQRVLVGFHGVSRDITDRKEAELALRDSERKYRELVDFLPISLFESDLQNNVISGNPFMLETFGYSQSDLEKGLKIDQMIISGDLDRFGRNVQDLISGEKWFPSEYMGFRKDSSVFPFLIFPSIIIREDKPIGIRGAIIDLTERKRAEESLQKSNLSLAEAQRIAHIGNWEWSIENSEIYLSDEIYRIIGITSEMFDGTYESLSNYIFPEAREAIKKAIEKAVIDGEISDIEHRIIHYDEAVRDVRHKVEPIIDDTGKIVRVIGIVQDVTEKNQVEKDLQNARDQLHQSEKLASMGRLSAGVAHEILNPVNIISMELQILQNLESLSSEVNEELNICMAQIGRIVSIADNLKQFSRIPEKKTIMADINDVVARVLTLYATQLKIEGIETVVQYRPDLPEIAMDKEKIEQVILNLITNAITAMEGKEVKILYVTTEKETLYGDKDYLKIMIADTGTGIKNEHRSKIFDPFFTTKGKWKGTGLGLSISYGIIHDHGGKIWTVNNEWGGASFFVRFPVKSEIEKNNS